MPNIDQKRIKIFKTKLLALNFLKIDDFKKRDGYLEACVWF